MQDVHDLALVRVDALDLDIEDHVGIDEDAAVRVDIVGKIDLPEAFDLRKFRQKRFVRHMIVEVRELIGRLLPCIADRLVDERSQLRIRTDEPAAMRDAVRLVVELRRIIAMEELQRVFFQDVRMNRRDAVDTVTADDGEPRHVHLPVLDDGKLVHHLLVVREAPAHLLKVAAVDLLDDHIDARQKRAEHVDRPLLQSFRHDRVVRVRHRLARDLPRLVPAHPLFIDKDAHELGDGDRRMRVVDVDGDLLREILDIHAREQVVAHDALHARRHEEVLLDEAQAAAFVGAVVGVQVLRDTLDEVAVFLLRLNLLVCHCSIVGKIAVDFGVPQAQRIDRIVAEADDRHVVRNSHDRHVVFVYKREAAVLLLLHVGIAIELDVDRLICLAILPLEAVAEPIVRNLDLVALDDLLLEESVLVAYAAAVTGKPQRGHRVDKAGCKTPKAAIAETRVRLLGEYLVEVDAEFFQSIGEKLHLAQVDEIRAHEPPEQEFDRKIVDLLVTALRVRLIRLDPVLADVLFHDGSNGRINLMRREVGEIAAPQDMRRSQKPLFQTFLCQPQLIPLVCHEISPPNLHWQPLGSTRLSQNGSPRSETLPSASTHRDADEMQTAFLLHDFIDEKPPRAPHLFHEASAQERLPCGRTAGAPFYQTTAFLLTISG